MKTLKRGDLVCFVPLCLDLWEGKPPTIGVIMRDWDRDTHGDRIEVWFKFIGETTTEPDHIQRLEEYGQYGT